MEQDAQKNGAEQQPCFKGVQQKVPFPGELLPVRTSVQGYVHARIRQFGLALAQRLKPQLTEAQAEEAVSDTLANLGAKDASPERALRLVLRHDCLSSGCGEPSCLLCQYNPNRLCKRNLKNKYLIDDNLKAKCGASLRVELVDEGGGCVLEGLPPGMQLEVHVLNGEKYKEICPDNVLLSHQQLRSCIISHQSKALLRREGSSEDQLRCFLQLETGTTSLSDLHVTTSSEALLPGKAPTFRLLVWAVDEHGEPVSNVTYVVSENFVVATKRVKHAQKSDIPSVTDHVSKLVHIGKATLDKMQNLRQAAVDEGFSIQIPDDLNRLEKVGQFQQLVELSEMNPDLKHKVRHLLKLSPEKWDEVAQHAQGAVVPDFRPRVWWCAQLREGLLFSAKSGSVCMDQPIGLVKASGNPGGEDVVVPLSQLDSSEQERVRSLKDHAAHCWCLPQHPGWSIYFKEGAGAAQNPLITTAVLQQQLAAGQVPNMAAAGPQNPGLPPASLAGLSGTGAASPMGIMGGGSPLQQHANFGGGFGAVGPTGVSNRRGASSRAAAAAAAAADLEDGGGARANKRRRHAQARSPPTPPSGAATPPPLHAQQQQQAAASGAHALPPALLAASLPLPAHAQAAQGAHAAAHVTPLANGSAFGGAAGAGAQGVGGEGGAGGHTQPGGVQGNDVGLGLAAGLQSKPSASAFVVHQPWMSALADQFPCWPAQSQPLQQQPQGAQVQGQQQMQAQGQHPQHDSLSNLVASLAGGASNVLPTNTVDNSSALLLASNPLNPLVSHAPMQDGAAAHPFIMPSFTLPTGGVNGIPAINGVQMLQETGSLQGTGNGSFQLGSPPAGPLQANGGLGSGSLQLNPTLLPQENSIDGGVLPIPKLQRTEAGADK